VSTILFVRPTERVKLALHILLKLNIYWALHIQNIVKLALHILLKLNITCFVFHVNSDSKFADTLKVNVTCHIFVRHLSKTLHGKYHHIQHILDAGMRVIASTEQKGRVRNAHLSAYEMKFLIFFRWLYSRYRSETMQS
jgi:hypothetical protein